MAGRPIARVLAFTVLASASAFAQQQQPSYQPGWPCTGKPRSFDPSYAKIAEATGGHLFLFDKPEVTGMSTLAIGDMNHKQTIIRATGKIDSYVDIPFWVDSSIESLFVVASLQCMQTIYLYDSQRTGVNAQQYPVPAGSKPGEDAWFKAGRIATLPHPQPGQWVLRLLGTGPYFVAIQGKAEAGMGTVDWKDGVVSAWLDSSIAEPTFQLVDAAGEVIGPLNMAMDPQTPGHYAVRLDHPPDAFRLQVEWNNTAGERVQRTDSRLHESNGF